ncbi:unnamed protein product [Prunus armeniaca]|uniref:Uncharacterized protein n=1 Tax=Prunus armeniaca TaxID=36596 RepID=A0A6J5X8V9_PRUAR|nr:unnamed protein product [Prunus armeniaca]
MDTASLGSACLFPKKIRRQKNEPSYSVFELPTCPFVSSAGATSVESGSQDSINTSSGTGTLHLAFYLLQYIFLF